MTLLTYSNADEFYEKVKSFLIQREAENNILFGIIAGLRAGLYSDNPAYMACVEQDGEVVLVALRTPPQALLLSTCEHPSAIKTLVEHTFSLYGNDLTEVNADPEVGKEFCEQWSQLSGQTYQLTMPMHIYRLDAVKPVTSVAGNMRLSTAEDDFLVDWFMAFIEDTFGNADRIGAERNYQRFLDMPLSEMGIGIWEVDGVAVSMAAYLGSTPNGMRIAYVYTPKEHRRKGYASAITATITQHVLDMGKSFCFLFTDRNNPTSNHIYQEIGYRLVSDVDRYQLG